MDQAYPDELLRQIGRVATTSALIEQEILLHASALAAQATDGKPSENLRLPFVRLRNRWYQLCRDNFPQKIMTSFVEPANSKLSAAWPIRGHIIHGCWRVLGSDRFEVRWSEQRTDLVDHKAEYTLSELSEIADDLGSLLKTIRDFHEPEWHRA